MEIGDRVKVSNENDNDNYDDFRGKILIVTHAEIGGIGYDETAYPQKLMCFVLEEDEHEKIPFSLYEYEVTEI